MPAQLNTHDEWIETDGLGGFASGTVSAIRTRRYHAVLLTAASSPSRRLVLVNGFDAWMDTPEGNFPLTSQVYEPGVVHPHAWDRIDSFEADPWPRWQFRLADGTCVEHQFFVPRNHSGAILTWRVLGESDGCVLSVRPFISGRDYHQLQQENADFRFDLSLLEGRVIWRPYPDKPAIVSLTNGEYVHQEEWYRSFLYEEERDRGLDYLEDLASPGAFRWDMSQGEAIWMVAAEGHEGMFGARETPVEKLVDRWRSTERVRRNGFPSILHQAGDAYVVRRAAGHSVVAGYPWYQEWSRDTFVAIRGLCIRTGRLEEAKNILLAWAPTIDGGMLPNVFPEPGAGPEFNSVDASLWYVVAAHEFFQKAEATKFAVSEEDRTTIRNAMRDVVAAYSDGTRYGIRMDSDGLLAAGGPGLQLTWMDSKIDDWVVTPRVGKPVEVQALWLNALRIMSEYEDQWGAVFKRGAESFQERFWNAALGRLYDVVDVDHRPGTSDAAFRPNQIFAVGGLPFALMDGDPARAIVDGVESHLYTPMGIRTLAAADPGYRGRYEGGVVDRDGACHQGTVWPWLLGPFIDAWIRVRGNEVKARDDARARFLPPIEAHLEKAGIGHLSEMADGDSPHRPRGCPFHAISVAEALRIAGDHFME
jgi:predicted glycogen debranching enzyme